MDGKKLESTSGTFHWLPREIGATTVQNTLIFKALTYDECPHQGSSRPHVRTVSESKSQALAVFLCHVHRGEDTKMEGGDMKALCGAREQEREQEMLCNTKGTPQLSSHELTWRVLILTRPGWPAEPLPRHQPSAHAWVIRPANTTRYDCPKGSGVLRRNSHEIKTIYEETKF